MTVETPQEWKNTLSEDLSGKAGEWKPWQGLQEKLTTRAKERILPRVDGQPSLRCPHAENFPEWTIMH